MRLLNIGKE